MRLKGFRLSASRSPKITPSFFSHMARIHVWPHELKRKFVTQLSPALCNAAITLIEHIWNDTYHTSRYVDNRFSLSTTYAPHLRPSQPSATLTFTDPVSIAFAAGGQGVASRRWPTKSETSDCVPVGFFLVEGILFSDPVAFPIGFGALHGQCRLYS